MLISRKLWIRDGLIIVLNGQMMLLAFDCLEEGVKMMSSIYKIIVDFEVHIKPRVK